MSDLTEKDLENMKNHKYQSTGYTTLDNKMNPFWLKCASYLPYRFTPNMVTVSGLCCQYIAVLLVAVYDLTFSQKLPAYVYIVCSFMIFMAQTLDAIDGKHARNTKRSSSLGQLMDHGCDSMDNFLFCIVLCQAYLFGNSIQSIILQLFIQIPFYAYTLEEHLTGKLRTQMNNIGVTEYQFFTMGLLLFPAFFGHVLAEVQVFRVRLCFLILYLSIIPAVYLTIYLIKINSSGVKDAFEKFKPLATLFAFCTAELIGFKLNTYQTKPLLIIVLNGLYFALFSSKLIIANMAKKEIKILDIDIIVFVTGVIGAVVIGNPAVEFYILVGMCLWLAYRFYMKVIMAIFKMMDYLKIGF